MYLGYMVYNLRQFYPHTIGIFDDYSTCLIYSKSTLFLFYFNLLLIHLGRYKILPLLIYPHHNEPIDLPSNHYHTPHIFGNNSSF